jgi:hypothetical protein
MAAIAATRLSLLAPGTTALAGCVFERAFEQVFVVGIC